MPPAANELGPLWEVAKGVMLFVITGCVSYFAKSWGGVREMLRDHDREIYGKDGQNGLKRGLRAVNDRVDVMNDRVGALDDRFVAIDAVAVVEAERAAYPGPERRHSPLHVIVEKVRQELLDDERRRDEERQRQRKD